MLENEDCCRGGGPAESRNVYPAIAADDVSQVAQILVDDRRAPFLLFGIAGDRGILVALGPRGDRGCTGSWSRKAFGWG